MPEQMTGPLDHALDYARGALTDEQIAVAVRAAADQQRQPPPGLVQMTRRDLPGQPIYVDAESVDYYEQIGWQAEPDTGPQTQSETAAEEPR
jgi:hypothetical protein